ncbi:MAG: S41 family peptidase [Crocinitomicaceae bacterium]|nr:S41 family peptidase [Crocinitomicaceae bacterium]
MKNYQITLLTLVILSLFGCKKVFFEPEPENNPEALFENLWTTFNTDYAPFEERGVDWQEQYQIFRPQVNASTTNEELKDIFKLLLSSLNDGHVELTTPNSDVFYSNSILDQRIDHELFDLDLIKSNYLQDDFLQNGNDLNTYGMIGNIGYWHIEAVGQNMLEIDEILNHFSSADGLIIDLRHNKGGNSTYAFSEFGRLTNSERFVLRSKTKSGTGPNDYTEWYSWNVSPSGDYFDKPIVLLTDRYTISAGERAVMAFKTLPNVIHVGDTTNGAFSTKMGKELANGWFYTVSTQIIQFNDGVSYEGSGMSPDIYIKNTLSEMLNGQDKTLEEAMSQF